MNLESIKVLFEEMRKSGVLMFKFTGTDGSSYKVVMSGVEVNEAVGVPMETNENSVGFDATRVSIYENDSLKLKDFN